MTAIEIDLGISHCRLCDCYGDEGPNASDTMMAILDEDNKVIEYLHPKCYKRILTKGV